MPLAYVVKKILRVVPPKFLTIACTIEQFTDLEKMTVEETVGSLKAHKERLRGQVKSSGSQLLLTEEEWLEREKEEGKLLLTRDEWIRRSNKGGSEQKNREKESNRGQYKSRVGCFNCNLLGHYAAECRRLKHDKKKQ